MTHFSHLTHALPGYSKVHLLLESSGSQPRQFCPSRGTWQSLETFPLPQLVWDAVDIHQVEARGTATQDSPHSKELSSPECLRARVPELWSQGIFYKQPLVSFDGDQHRWQFFALIVLVVYRKFKSFNFISRRVSALLFVTRVLTDEFAVERVHWKPSAGACCRYTMMPCPCRRETPSSPKWELFLKGLAGF